MPHDPVDTAQRIATSPEAAALAAGIAAAVARLCLYAGPPRPRVVAAMDFGATALLGFAAGEIGLWWTGNFHFALGAGMAVGVLGWNEVQRWAWGFRNKFGGGSNGA